MFLDATVVFCGYLEIVLNVLGPTDATPERSSRVRVGFGLQAVSITST